MGGLARKVAGTCVTFLIGVLAIAGVGIPATSIGLGGFFSKDEILAVAWHKAFWKGEVETSEEMPTARTPEERKLEAKGEEPAAKHESAAEHGIEATLAKDTQWPRKLSFLFWLPLAIAYITPFYMMREW